MTPAEQLAETLPPMPAGDVDTVIAVVLAADLAPVKACRCGRTFALCEWRDLRLVGFMDDGVDVLELRDCPCGSTIAIEAPPTGEDLRRAVARTLERMRSVGIEP